MTTRRKSDEKKTRWTRSVLERGRENNLIQWNFGLEQLIFRIVVIRKKKKITSTEIRFEDLVDRFGKVVVKNKGRDG